MSDHCNHNHSDFEDTTMDEYNTRRAKLRELLIRQNEHTKALLESEHWMGSDDGTDYLRTALELSARMLMLDYESDWDGFMKLIDPNNDVDGIYSAYACDGVCNEIYEYCNSVWPNAEDIIEGRVVQPSLDENGNVVDQLMWLKHCMDDMGSDGQRITCARALQIANDVMFHYLHKTMFPYTWTDRDIEIAMGVIAAMRVQRGVTGPDAEALGYTDGMYMTQQCDIFIYG